MYVFETFLAGIHWSALERILERVRSVNGTRSERKWSAFGMQMGRVRNANERVRNANGRERSVRLFLSSIVSCKFSFVISI